MKKTLTGIAVGATLIIGGGTVDLVPREAAMNHVEQWLVSEPSEYVTATGTIKNIHPKFEDTDGDGYVSAKVGVNSKGERVYEQITEKDYKEKGATLQILPVQYQITVAEALLEEIVQVAEAAIAFDAVYGIDYFVGTSGTKAFTVTGSDTILMVMFDNEGGPDDFTGVTWNGSESLTEIGVRVQEGTTGRYSHTYALMNPTTGTHNVVISRSSSNQVNYIIVSYTGVDQSALPSTYVTKQFAPPIAPGTTDLTTLVSNSWTVLHARGARTESASTGSTLRSASSIGTVMDSNSALSAGAHSMSFSQSPDNSAACTQMFELEEAVTAPVSTTNNGLRGTFLGTWYGN